MIRFPSVSTEQAVRVRDAHPDFFPVSAAFLLFFQNPTLSHTKQPKSVGTGILLYAIMQMTVTQLYEAERQVQYIRGGK